MALDKLLGALAIVGLVSYAAACSSPCDDLQTECDGCTNPVSKAFCDATVQFDDDDLCQAAIDQGNVCGSSSSSSSTSTSSSSSSSTSGTGGGGGV